MTKRFLVPLLVLTASLAAAPSASAAWTKAGDCRIPASQQDGVFEDLDSENNSFSTTRVPCYIAAFAIMDMLKGNEWTRDSFTHTSMGARWFVKLSCRGRVDTGSPAPQPGRVISCRVTKGEDAERNLRGGSISWTTAYTG